MNPIKSAYRFWKLRASWLGEGGQPVERSVAQYRADVCNQCPMNEHRGITEAFTASVAMTLARQIEMKEGMSIGVHGEESLHICSACNCWIPLKIWTPLKHIIATTPPEDIEALHPNCWIRKGNQT